MKKKIVLFAVLLILFVTCLCACNRRTSISEEYSKESYIIISNKVMDRLTSIGVTWYIGDTVIGSTGMVHADNSLIKDEDIGFVIPIEEVPAGANLEDFAIEVSVTEDNGDVYELERLNIPLTLGKDFFFELTYKNGSYGIDRVE